MHMFEPYPEFNGCVYMINWMATWHTSWITQNRITNRNIPLCSPSSSSFYKLVNFIVWLLMSSYIKSRDIGTQLQLVIAWRQQPYNAITTIFISNLNAVFLRKTKTKSFYSSLYQTIYFPPPVQSSKKALFCSFKLLIIKLIQDIQTWGNDKRVSLGK